MGKWKLLILGSTWERCAASMPTGPAPQIATTSPSPTKPSSHACLQHYRSISELWSPCRADITDARSHGHNSRCTFKSMEESS